MFDVNRKIRRPIGVNIVVLTLLQVTSTVILSACQQPTVKIKSPEQDKTSKPIKAEQQESDTQLNKKQPTKSDSKKDKDEDTQDDDDPE
jgi:hypothetical protein